MGMQPKIDLVIRFFDLSIGDWDIFVSQQDNIEYYEDDKVEFRLALYNGNWITAVNDYDEAILCSLNVAYGWGRFNIEDIKVQREIEAWAATIAAKLNFKYEIYFELGYD